MSLEFARRLQHEYDSEMTPERTLMEEQREAYSLSLQQDQTKRRRKAEPTEEKAVETNTETKLPNKQELRALRIKALSNPM